MPYTAETRSNAWPVRSIATMVFSKVGEAGSAAMRSISARFSAMAVSKAGFKSAGWKLPLAQLVQVDVADVSEPRSPRAVLAPAHAAPHVELVPAAPSPQDSRTELPARARGDLAGKLIHETVQKRRQPMIGRHPAPRARS